MNTLNLRFTKKNTTMKKTAFFRKTALILACSLLMIGCQDNFLEQTNPNQISTGTFWKNMEDLNLGLVAAYKGFSSPNNYKLIDELVRSDMAWGSGYQRPFNVNQYYQQTFNEASSVVSDKWSALYRTIFRANQVIIAVENLKGKLKTDTEEARAVVMGAEARFIRGYAYFLLYNSFNNGKVVIWDAIPGGDNGFSSVISPAATVKAFFLADLQYASENLPVTWADSEKGRVTAGAAVAVIGQTYLYENNYPEAAKYFKRVIEDYGYSLTPDIGSNFTTKDELNQESILEIVYSMAYKSELNQWDSRDVATTSGYNKQLTGAAGQWFGAVVANWLILEYRNEKLDYADDRNKLTVNGVTKFRKFSLRTSNSIAIVDDVDTGYYGSPQPGQVAIFNVKMTAFWRKHTNWDLGAKDEETLSPGKVRSGINERLIRLGQIYLQYAECLNEQGKTDEALVYINKVRRRSAVQLLGLVGSGEYPLNDHDNVSYNQQQVRDHLRLKEYPLELSCEGSGIDRNVDLRRWGASYKADRFKALAAKTYSADNFEVTNVDGTKVTRWGSIVKEVAPALADATWAEFGEAAKNYNPLLHSYWPIPNAELIANPDVLGTL